MVTNRRTTTRRTTTRRTTRGYMAVKVCRFDDSEGFREVVFHKNGVTVQEVLSKAGITLYDGEVVNDYKTARELKTSGKVKNGQQLVISGNVKSGN